MTMYELFQSMQSGDVVSRRDAAFRVMSVHKDWVTLSRTDGGGLIDIYDTHFDEIKKVLSAYDYIMSERFYSNERGGHYFGDGVLDTFLKRYGDKLKDVY